MFHGGLDNHVERIRISGDNGLDEYLVVCIQTGGRSQYACEFSIACCRGMVQGDN